MALFVKFETDELAAAAIEAVSGRAFDVDAPQQVLRAEFARRNMEVKQHEAPLRTAPPQWDHAAPRTFAPPGRGDDWGGRGAPAELVTITVVKITSKGHDPDALMRFFQNRRGFVKAQMNDRIDSMFVKFKSGYDAEQAIQEAHAERIVAEWARRNLDDEPGERPAIRLERPPGPPVGFGENAGYGYGNASTRGRIIEGEELVTVVVLGMRDKGLKQEDMQNFFSMCVGFVKFQMNDRIGGCFAKFDSASNAEIALQEANARELGAEWARRNLDDDIGARSAPAGYNAPPPMQQLAPAKRQRVAGGEMTTITCLGLKDKELSLDDVEQWFRQRPGFEALTRNERIGGLFVKFRSMPAAEQAMHDANQNDYGVEWARRNLDPAVR